tara:strand:- start:1330 stop:1875 length:546 start_codon:yes stop_codon:yes gene_type:complete
MVGITIMGAAAPSVMQMTLAPVEAQARARNFSRAEAAAVAFAAANEGQEETNLSIKPDICDDPVSEGSGSFSITCHGGEPDSNYRQSVTRSYRTIQDNSASYNWDRPIPGNIGANQCPAGDNWGFNAVTGFNYIHGQHVGFCIPRVAWTEEQYLDSDPSQWVYDLREFARFRDYPIHPAFL